MGVAARVLLVPLDSRPATSQFPKLLGNIASVAVDTPDMESLGRFTTPGKPAAIKQWLEMQPMDGVSAIIVSSDMLGYGGLIASRLPYVDVKTALNNLSVLQTIRREHPNIPIYVFSSLMRTAPTATNESRTWRMSLAKYVEMKSRYVDTREPQLPALLAKLSRNIPAGELQKYLNARKRNLAVLKALLEMVREGTITYLTIGTDDAQVYGPHVAELRQLNAASRTLGIERSVFFCEGIDQHASLLLSRALLKTAGWSPKVFVKFSDPASGKKLAGYESQPLASSIRGQITASGATQVATADKADYFLYLNAPGTSNSDLNSFALSITRDISQSLRVAVADINFAKDGSADSRLISELWRQQKAGSLLAFAGWNTAGNTIGTAIPQANIYLTAKRLGVDEVQREKSEKVFLLHRLISDYGYHKYVRPAAYRMAEMQFGATREEAYGEVFQKMQDWVQRNTSSLLRKYFREQFEERQLTQNCKIAALKDVRVSLPWPRAFEVRVDFDFVLQPVMAAGQASGR